MDHCTKGTENAFTARIAAPGEPSEAQRQFRITRVRRDLAAGTYESAAKLNCAIDRLLTALNLTKHAHAVPQLCVGSCGRCSTVSL